MDTGSALPFVDEQRTLVPAPPDQVWQRLLVRVPRFADAERFVALLGARPRRFSGGPLEQGATLPGFEVAEAVPGRRLRLTGRHHFSRYALVLTLAEEGGGTWLSARTYAAFPGLHGLAYRTLVIGSGAHHFLVARLLRSVRENPQR